MGGEGSMIHAIKSLKNNRNLLKRNGKSGLSGSYSNLQLKDFPKATPEEIKEIRKKTLRAKKREIIKLRITLFVFILLIFSVFVYLIQ